MNSDIALETSTKTIGDQAARLIITLREQNRSLFSTGDVRKITGLSPVGAAGFVRDLIDRGLVTRLKPGLFNLVPFEMGWERQYMANPYLVARELCRARPYYLSHASAMDLHAMVTQPQLVVHVTSPHFFRGVTILGTEFHFVRCKEADFFGYVAAWIDKTEQVYVSDLERTVIDGLRQPQYCGGFSEVAKGFWMRRGDMQIVRLVDYALRLNVGAVIRRLGFLLEVSEVDASDEIERLQSHLTDSYALLDPTLPSEGEHVARWRLQLNVTREEIEALRST